MASHHLDTCKQKHHKCLQVSICKIKGTGIRTASVCTQKLDNMYTHANQSGRPEAPQKHQGQELQRRHESSSKHFHSTLTPALQMDTDGDERQCSHFVCLRMRVLGIYLGIGGLDDNMGNDKGGEGWVEST